MSGEAQGDSADEHLSRDDVAFVKLAHRRHVRNLARWAWAQSALRGSWRVLRWLLKEGVPTGAVIIAAVIAWRSGEVSKLLGLFT